MIDRRTAVPVVRSYRNSFIEKRVAQCLEIFNNVVVVTDASQDLGNTKGWLANWSHDPRVALISMEKGYTWSNALNRALSHIDMVNAIREKNGEDPFEFMFPLSVEASFIAEDVEKMLQEFNDATVGIVGTSFQGKQKGGAEVSTGRSYRHPRNTGMAIRLNIFAERMIRNFDPFCDDIGGMEDIDLICRMKAFTHYTVKMLDLRVPLLLGVNHNQAVKEKREQDAMDRVFERLSAYAREIESVIASMRLRED